MGGGLKQVRIASHHNSRLGRRICHVGIQVCEIAAETPRQQVAVRRLIALGSRPACRVSTRGQHSRKTQIGGTNGQGHQPGTSIQR